MALIGTNTRVEVQASLGTVCTVTALTQANPGVATYTGGGSPSGSIANGDVVVFTVTGGMVELDGQAVRAANVTGTTFELEGIDTTDYSAWTTGTAKEVATWETFASAQNVSMPNPAPTKIETTTLIDRVKQYEYGLPEAPDGTVTGLFNPTGAAEILVKAATKDSLPLAFRISFPSGQKTIFNANVSGGTGFELATNAAATATTSFTPIQDVMHYST